MEGFFLSLKWMFCHQNWTSYTPKIAISTFIRKLEREQLLCIYTMIRNPYLWNVFRLILSLKSSKMRIFSLNPLIFKLKYIGFQERNRDVTIITHAFRTFKPCKKTLGQRLIHAYYFSDLSILPPIISRI